jgi:NADP-dependent 3-hydroxy acid dehydrogenase YdfG
MTRNEDTSTRRAAPELDRRQFLGTAIAFGWPAGSAGWPMGLPALGAGGLLASLGLSGCASNPQATSATAATASAAAAAPSPPSPPAAAIAPPPGRPPLPAEPKVSQPPPLTDLRGKVAYISAASDGIGLGIARAASNAGMIVVIGYRNEERLQAALPLFKPGNPGVMPFKHDVTDRAGWNQMVKQVKDKYGKLHLVVNNAGIKTLRQASQAKYDEWDNAVAVNFTAIYNSVAACLPHMMEHGEGGHFVTTASMGGLLPGVNAGVYTSTKIAAVGIMEALRVELESTNIGTSVFCPGLVNTDNYIGSGEKNPYHPHGAGGPPPGRPMGQRLPGPPPGMDPMEAGERVLNGVIHNDLFILSHPEFKAGMQERFEAIMLSTPAVEAPIPAPRVAYERVVLRCGIYPREIEHRNLRRSSYREV